MHACTHAHKQGGDTSFFASPMRAALSFAGLACEPLVENLVEGGEGVPPVSDDVPTAVRELLQSSLVHREPFVRSQTEPRARFIALASVAAMQPGRCRVRRCNAAGAVPGSRFSDATPAGRRCIGSLHAGTYCPSASRATQRSADSKTSTSAPAVRP